MIYKVIKKDRTIYIYSLIAYLLLLIAHIFDALQPGIFSLTMESTGAEAPRAEVRICCCWKTI